MKLPEEWAEDICALFDEDNSVVEDMLREAMQSVYEDVLQLIEDEFVDDTGIAEGISQRMIEIIGEDYC